MDAVIVESLHRVFRTTTGVVKRKSKEIVALDNVSLEVAEGELFGLLGPNGVGKTTLTKILCTILLPSRGRASVLGLDVVGQARGLRSRIGIVFGGERGLYWRLSARDTLRYFADLYHVPPARAEARIPELLSLVGLADRAEERVEGYSQGMKQRLHIARGLIHDPQVLFLDEPTIGLDPVAAREIRRLILELRQQGKTVFLTSHYMYEIDEMCDRVAVLNRGKILMVNTPRDLKRLVSDLEVVEIEARGLPEHVVDAVRRHARVAAVTVQSRDEVQALLIQAEGGAGLVGEFLAILAGVPVVSVITRQPTLEDAYVRLVGAEAIQT